MKIFKKKLLKMREELLKYLNEAIELLECSKHIDPYAFWLKKKIEMIKDSELDSKEFKKALKEVSESLVGMGSFDDIPIYPREDSKLSEKEVRKKQSELRTKIWETIENILNELKLEKRQRRLKKRIDKAN